MAGCELCGMEGELVTAIVEGSALTVCKKCSSFGILVSRPPVAVPQPRPAHGEEEKDYIVDHWGVLVKRGREEKKMLQEDLGKAIGERVSVIHKIESESFKPSLEMARKLEHCLGIRLVEEKGQDDIQPKVTFKDSKLTIGDMIKLKQKVSD